MKYNVTLEMEVEAESSVDALNIGIGAAEHLNDTFNDDESINPLMKVVVVKTKEEGV